MARKIKVIAAMLMALLIGCAFLVLNGLFREHSFTEGGEYLFTINEGDGLVVTAERLRYAGIISSARWFKLASWLQNPLISLQPGIVHIKNPASIWQVAKIIVTGPKKNKLTLLEGWGYHEVNTFLNQNSLLIHTCSSCSSKDWLRQLDKNATYPSLEGLLLPDSFYYFEGAKDREIYQRAYRSLQQALNKVWNERDAGLPYRNSYELLIMASLVEKETGDENDRRLIAAVLINRLKKGMPLQSDPTVIYGLKDHYNGYLSKEQLRKDTPYNTYTRLGLPPTPIANPSRASLEAAAHPAAVNYLYFVAKGDHSGKSQFSHTLAEHHQAVHTYHQNQARMIDNGKDWEIH